MKKLLFFFLSLLISIPAFSMDLISHQLTVIKLEKEVKDMMETVAEFKELKAGIRDLVKKQEKEKEKIDPETILTPFNEETQKIKISMTQCLDFCIQLEFNTQNFGLKEKFAKEHEELEHLTDNLYNKFLTKQTITKICVGAPRFNTLIEQTNNMKSLINQKQKEIHHDHINTFSETVAGFLESLNHAKAHVEK